MNKVVDINAVFKRYVASIIAGMDDPSELEDAIADIYLDWLKSYSEELGCAPEEYFDKHSGDELVSFLIDYVERAITVPDLLLDSIVDAAPEDALIHLAAKAAELFDNADAQKSARLEAISLLNQIGSAKAEKIYLDILLSSGDEELIVAAADALAAAGAVQQAKAALESARGKAFEALLDIVTEFDRSDELFGLVVSRMKLEPERLDFYVALSMRFAPEQTVPVLREMIEGPIGYLDFIALRNALEALGERVDDSRDFSNDPDYERLNER